MRGIPGNSWAKHGKPQFKTIVKTYHHENCGVYGENAGEAH